MGKTRGYDGTFESIRYSMGCLAADVRPYYEIVTAGIQLAGRLVDPIPGVLIDAIIGIFSGSVDIYTALGQKKHRPKPITGLTKITSGVALIWVGVTCISLLAPVFAGYCAIKCLLSLDPLWHALRCRDDIEYYKKDLQARQKLTDDSSLWQAIEDELMDINTSGKYPEYSKKKLADEVISKQFDTSMLFIASIGAILLCIPGLQIAGIALLAMAAGMCIYQHRKDLYNQIIEPIYKLLTRYSPNNDYTEKEGEGEGTNDSMHLF